MLTLDVNNSCRICMISSTNLLSIFSNYNDRKISELIVEISAIKIEESDLLSKKICVKCSDKVIEFIKFKQLCIDSDDTVRYNILLDEQTESLEIVDVDENLYLVNENIQQENEENADTNDYMEVLINDDDEYGDEEIKEAIVLNENTEDLNVKENTVVIERVYSKTNVRANDYVFESQDELTQKMREAHFAKEQQKKHKCPYCAKSFLYPSKVARHVSAVHKNLDQPKKMIKKNHNCPICGKAFVSQFKVRRHMVVHDTELKSGLQKNWSRNYFLCETCNRKFHTQITFDRHILICDMLRKSTLERPDDYQYICIICSEAFKEHDEMVDHMKNTHDQHTDHHCQFCPDVVGNLQEIIKHGRYHEENVTYRCCTCDKIFPNGDEIIVHLLRHADYKPFSCNVEGCGKTFFDKYKMKQHTLTHDPDAKKNYTCEFCQRSFAQLDYLNCHIRRKHSSVKPYSCSFCPKQFAFLHDLNLHLANHTGNKKHICPICDATFTKAWSLKQHMALHEMSSSPIKCKRCDFLASSKSQLKLHYASHQEMDTNARYLCGECNVVCKTEDAIESHLVEAHSRYSFIEANNSEYNLEIP